MASITRRQPSSDIAATYLTSGEKTKSVYLYQTGRSQEYENIWYTPTILFFDTFQWLTGFLAVFSFSPLPPPETFVTGCHGGIVTNILSSEFHSPAGVGSECALEFEDEAPLLEVEVGSWGVNAPSSRSLS